MHALRPFASNLKIDLHRWWSALLVGICLLCLPNNIQSACGGGDYSFKGYSFIHPGLVVDTTGFAPYFLRFNQLYSSYGSSNLKQQKSNLEEWKERFCDLAPIKDLRRVIYQSTLDELELLSTAVRSKNFPLDFRMSKNLLAIHMKEEKCVEAANYFVFAKNCEFYALAGNSWDTPERDTVAMKKLIRDGKRQFRKTKSNYIRLRYLYQLVRLAHYAKDYSLTLTLYDELMPKTDPEESILNLWILGHRAGAMRSLGRTAEAAYHFMQIFLDSPEKRESAYQSFYIKNDEQWHECMLLCQDDRERAGLYALRATAEDSKAAEEMKKIYELDPNSHHLELLLAKEIRKLERDLLGLEFNDQRRENLDYHQIPRKHAGQYLLKLQELVRLCVEEQNVARPQLWELADGYLEYLAGDFYSAERTFAALGPQLQNDTLKAQLAAFELALNVHNYEEMDEDNEEAIFQIIKEHPSYKEFSDFPDFINDRISLLYLDGGHPGKAFRCHYSLNELKTNPQLSLIEDLLAVCNKEERNKLEEALVIDENGISLRNQLLDMKGSYLMSRGKLEAALAVFKQIPREAWDDFQFNPFLESFNDCVFCPITDSIPYYNKVEIIERIFELQFKSKSDMEGSSRYFYELGNAFYNMSYFGSSWEVMDYFRSGSSGYYDKDGIYPYYGPYGNLENTDLTIALANYDRARQLAGGNSELAAKATFMAARCERLGYFMSPNYSSGYSSRKIPEIPDDYNLNYQRLKVDYGHTRFYQQVIRECKYFRAYALK